MGKREQEKAARDLAMELRKATSSSAAASKATEDKELWLLEAIGESKKAERAIIKAGRVALYKQQRQREIRTQPREQYRPFLN